MPWKVERALVWDVTCPDTLAPSHSRMAVMEAGAVVNDVEFKKRQKYAHLTSSHYFLSIAVETVGCSGKRPTPF